MKYDNKYHTGKNYKESFHWIRSTTYFQHSILLNSDIFINPIQWWSLKTKNITELPQNNPNNKPVSGKEQLIVSRDLCEQYAVFHRKNNVIWQIVMIICAFQKDITILKTTTRCSRHPVSSTVQKNNSYTRIVFT